MKKLLCLLFACCLCAEEIDLSLYEKSVYSQNGEDGVLAKIFQVIAPQNKFCVDIGAYDGVTGSNTHLLFLQGWNGVLLDRSYEIPEIFLHKAFITAENIQEVLQKYQVPFEFDLLSIDIDYNDFYIWKGLSDVYRPAVVVIEYNATHLPDQDKVVKYRPFYSGDTTNYYGASILALYRLGKAKGYSLVYAEKSGVNLFFIREDVLAASGVSFKDMDVVEKIYRYPTYGKGPNGGHLSDKKERPYVSAEELLNGPFSAIPVLQDKVQRAIWRGEEFFQ